MAQWVKYLLCKHEDLSSNKLIKLDIAAHIYNLSAHMGQEEWKSEQEKGPAGVIYIVVTKRPCLK